MVLMPEELIVSTPQNFFSFGGGNLENPLLSFIWQPKGEVMSNVNEKLWTYKEVCELVNRDYGTVWRWVNKGLFPEPIRINGRTLGWREKTIKQWLNDTAR
ncbi:AlpA family phage regulatory protein [uncultured Ferrimonas sp.]|uniref:helix-turn-helix transcriptional regulator n=1 Tax=uncultured Ferrimonas sp. TaxID=432640 RepID=UPI00261E0C9A|nr:AlpA family phage regulatory protein [uncultured Ferrimonas sp.]